MDNIILGSNSQFIRYSFEEFLNCILENGLKDIDFSLLTPHCYIDSDEYIDVCDVNRKFKEHDVNVYSVTAIPYRYSICSDVNSFQNKRTIEYYKNVIEFASKLNAKYVNLTCSGALYDKSCDELLNNCEYTLKRILPYAEEKDVTLLLGTVLGKESEYNQSTPVMLHLEELKDMLFRFNSKYLKAYMDIEVISLCGEKIATWFDVLKDDIKLVRFTDGNYNGYRVCGEGSFPLGDFLKEIKDSGYVGPLSTQIPNERYIENPMKAMKDNLTYLKNKMEEVR